jgi:DNA-binding NtrC family response regulator
MSTTLEHVSSAIVKRKKLLLIDPDPEVDDLLNQVVTSDGWDIERAPDNETALLFVRAGPFDLVITGQKTTGREDVDLLRKLRAIRPHLRMIILSGTTTPEDVIASLRENAFSYFSPPFDRVLLADMVHRQSPSLAGTMASRSSLLRPIGFE